MAAPRLVLVHGAFHGAWCWDRLLPELDRVGVDHEAVDLPFTTTEDDVATVRGAIDRSPVPVTLVGHSFGGALISAAAVEDGRPLEGVSSLVYVTALMTSPGQDVDLSGAPGMAAIRIGEDISAVPAEAAAEAFYNRCSPADAEWASGQLRPMPTALLMASPPPVPAFRVLPSTYIVCSDDRILPVAAQEQMAANAGAVHRLDSDHSPFLACPAALADLLSGLAAIR